MRHIFLHCHLAGTLQDRTARWLVERIDDLKLSVQTVKRERPFRIDAMVVLPEHLHAVWSLPPDDDDYAGRRRLNQIAI